MTSTVPFVKMNGTHNDFVIVDARVTPLDDPAGFAVRVCDRRGPVGADGLLLLLPSGAADLRVRIINADGSEAEMCGNGMRCVARYLDEHDGRAAATIETLAGEIGVRVDARDPYRTSVTMNEPLIGTPQEVAGFRALPVDVGNPHVVIFTDDLAAIDIASVGPRIEHDARYPHGTNVHFAQPLDDTLRVVHWERGAGATQACGTGAVACAAAAMTALGFRSPVTVYVPGGTLTVTWIPGTRAILGGDVVREFDATF